MECLAKAWVKKEGTEKSIQQTGSKFVFGADHFEDLGNMTTGYHKIKMIIFFVAWSYFHLHTDFWRYYLLQKGYAEDSDI